MTRATRIRFRGEASGHQAAEALLEQAGDISLDRRGVARAFLMKCPDGCGETLTVNLDPRSGKAWRAEYGRGYVSLYPSVWRDQGCEAHFVLWRDHLLWCDRFDPNPWDDEELTSRVKEELDREPDKFRQFEEIAAKLGVVIPWEVQWACHRLVGRGQAVVRDRSWFRAVSAISAPEGIKAEQSQNIREEMGLDPSKQTPARRKTLWDVMSRWWSS